MTFADCDALGDGTGEACRMVEDEWDDAFHCDSGIKDMPSKTKKWISRNETNAAPIAPEM